MSECNMKVFKDVQYVTGPGHYREIHIKNPTIENPNPVFDPEEWDMTVTLERRTPFKPGLFRQNNKLRDAQVLWFNEEPFHPDDWVRIEE